MLQDINIVPSNRTLFFCQGKESIFLKYTHTGPGGGEREELNRHIKNTHFVRLFFWNFKNFDFLLTVFREKLNLSRKKNEKQKTLRRYHLAAGEPSDC